MSYVDGFVIAVRKDRVDEYEKIARDAGASVSSTERLASQMRRR